MTGVRDNLEIHDPRQSGSVSSSCCCCRGGVGDGAASNGTGGRLIADRVVPHPPFGRVLVQWLLVAHDHQMCRVEVTGVNQVGRVVAREQMSVTVASSGGEPFEVNDAAYASARRLEASLCEQMQVTLETAWHDS